MLVNNAFDMKRYLIYVQSQSSLFSMGTLLPIFKDQVLTLDDKRQQKIYPNNLRMLNHQVLRLLYRLKSHKTQIHVISDSAEHWGLAVTSVSLWTGDWNTNIQTKSLFGFAAIRRLHWSQNRNLITALTSFPSVLGLRIRNFRTEVRSQYNKHLHQALEERIYLWFC